MAPIHFGILMIKYQALDAVGPLDILSSASKEFIQSWENTKVPGTAGMTEKAIDINYHHINISMDPVELTAGIKILPTTTIDNCPELDYLLIGGPDPATFVLDERFADFVRAHVKAGKTLFATCTGAWALASTGILDGKNATTNHGIVHVAKQQYPNVNWTADTQWVVDGNLWTAGGACAGMDMMASWVIQNYGLDLAKLGFGALDFEPRDIDGNSNQVIPQQHHTVAA